MNINRRLLYCLVVLAGGLFLTGWVRPVQGYVEAPMSLGAVIAQSSNIVLMRVERVDKQNNIIVYRKVQDLKGKHPTDIIQHNIGRGGFHPREWQYPMNWAEPGKIALFFHNGGASETCLGMNWYQAYGGGQNWGMSHGEPFLLRSFAGKVEKLAQIVTAVNAGQEAIASCMVDGNKEDLHLGRAKIQRLRVSLKLQDYNPKRDFVGWGGVEDFRWLQGMPGFNRYSALPRVDPEAQAISAVDFDGDGKPDLCLVGAGKVALVQNGGESFNEVNLPGVAGCRAAVWADYNGDGRPDLLLATPTGPRLFTNLGGGNFRDDTGLLPREPCYNLTAAAWMDQDGDGRPDILLGNGFHGLRLYRNAGEIKPKTKGLELGKWHYIGPFDNTGQNGFNTVYPPEKEIDLAKKYPGKGGEVSWKEGKFIDGQVNDLLNLFQGPQREFGVVYLYREIETGTPLDLPISLGSDDTLSVWLNGQRLLHENVYRAAAPDQNQLTLKLRAGKNALLLKICQGQGDWAFYFAAKASGPAPVTWKFEDVSAQVGLGPDGIGSTVKGDTLTVADVNGDGRPDFLYGAGQGVLVLNTPKGFVEAKASGLAFKPGKVGPAFGDFIGDGTVGLFVPQLDGRCKLFRNDGKGHFTEVTAQSGDLSKSLGMATSAAWGDFDNDGRIDLVVGCLRGPNRLYRNLGGGKFQDATEEFGLNQKVFNSQAVCLVDLNNDGVLDLVCNNEGQESCVLMGNPAIASKRTPVTLQVAGSAGVVGSQVRLLDRQGKLVAGQYICGGDGRGGQRAPLARFALAPGTYRVVVRYSSGVERGKEITVDGTPLRDTIDDQTPRVN